MFITIYRYFDNQSIDPASKQTQGFFAARLPLRGWRRRAEPPAMHKTGQNTTSVTCYHQRHSCNFVIDGSTLLTMESFNLRYADWIPIGKADGSGSAAMDERVCSWRKRIIYLSMEPCASE